MAELSTDCCAPEVQASCCEPSEKVACCGDHDGQGCGCAAGASEHPSIAATATAPVEQVREKLAPVRDHAR